jgi:citrate synthase
MEHGLTPSALAARLVYGSTPEATQSAIAAGLLAVGSVFVGTVEGCAENLARIVRGTHPRTIAEEHRTDKRALAGFGHPVHKPDDPRSPVLLGIADANGISGPHVAALRALSSAVDDVYGRHITVNATGAIAAVLSDAGIPIGIMRGFAVLARCAGLIGHVAEEQADPAMRAIWEAAERAVPYADE